MLARRAGFSARTTGIKQFKGQGIKHCFTHVLMPCVLEGVRALRFGCSSERGVCGRATTTFDEQTIINNSNLISTNTQPCNMNYYECTSYSSLNCTFPLAPRFHICRNIDETCAPFDSILGIVIFRHLSNCFQVLHKAV